MKIIERSPIGGDGGPGNVANRVRGIWQFGLSWDQEIQAQRVLIASLARVLDNSYTLISNVSLPRFSLPVPLVLVGQTGVRTLYVSAAKGIFRVKGDNWYKLDEKQQRYKAARPNLIRRTELMSRAIIDYLEVNNIYLDEAQPVLFFAQPGIHIDVSDSPIRLLHVDGVAGYAAGLKEEGAVLDAMEIQHIIDILTRSKPSKTTRDNLGFLKPLSNMVGYDDFQMKLWQLILLFILAIMMLIVVIITAMIIISST